MTPDAVLAATPDFQMVVAFALILGAFVLYSIERIPMEVTSLGAICAMLVFFHFFPVTDDAGENLLGPDRLLAGFANPALVTVVALLVIGQGMVRTGILDRGAQLVYRLGGGHPFGSVALALLVVLLVSGFLNNIPVVVIFIPIMQGLANRFGVSPSRMMIPLSYAAVLGGMTTLIGSGSNLLVNSALLNMGETTFDFFDFTIPGLVMALAGLVFVLFVVPSLLPDRAPLASAILGGSGKQFIAQIPIGADSELIGAKPVAGLFPNLPDITVRMIQRGEEAILPPFEGVELQAGDLLVVAGTRKALTEAATRIPGLLHPDIPDPEDEEGRKERQPWRKGQQIIAEVMIAPASRMAGQNLRMIGFRQKTRCLVLGLQRRSRMIRARMMDIRLQPGDVLLVQGRPDDVEELRANRDIVLLEWSATELPVLDHARRALLIFLAVVGLAALGIVPIVITALTGAAAMVASGVLNVRQAARSIDTNIATMIPAALALGAALQATGGATYVANALVEAMHAAGAGPIAILSGFYLVMAVLTNVVSSKAMAVLFTPIAVNTAYALDVNPWAFAIAVIFAANVAFATPIGYQTSLLVMGPGHYTFGDFLKAGTPLVLFMWVVFTLFVPWYYGMW